MDLFRLGGLFSQYRPRVILLRVVLLSILTLFIHIHATIWKSESKNSQEYHHMVWNETTNRPVEKGLLTIVKEISKTKISKS